MALIICPECNKEMSDAALACPHCGYPINHQSQKVNTPIIENQTNNVDTRANGKFYPFMISIIGSVHVDTLLFLVLFAKNVLNNNAFLSVYFILVPFFLLATSFFTSFNCLDSKKYRKSGFSRAALWISVAKGITFGLVFFISILTK